VRTGATVLCVGWVDPRSHALSFLPHSNLKLSQPHLILSVPSHVEGCASPFFASSAESRVPAGTLRNWHALRPPMVIELLAAVSLSDLVCEVIERGWCCDGGGGGDEWRSRTTTAARCGVLVHPTACCVVHGCGWERVPMQRSFGGCGHQHQHEHPPLPCSAVLARRFPLSAPLHRQPHIF
jgi:hypothetical protein